MRCESRKWVLRLLLPCVAVFALSCEKHPGTKPSHDSAPAPAIDTANAAVEDHAPATKVPDEDRSASPVIETDMQQESLNAFKDSKECRGITLASRRKSTRPGFRVHIVFDKADTPEMEEEWLWTVFDIRRDAKG